MSALQLRADYGEVERFRFTLPPNPVTAYAPDAAVMLELSYVHAFRWGAANPLQLFRRWSSLFWWLAVIGYVSVFL